MPGPSGAKRNSPPAAVVFESWRGTGAACSALAISTSHASRGSTWPFTSSPRRTRDDNAVEVGLLERHDRLSDGDVAIARTVERPPGRGQTLERERARRIGDRLARLAGAGRRDGDARGRCAALIDDLAADRRRASDENDDVRLLLGDADAHIDRHVRAPRALPRRELVVARPQAGEAELAGGIGVHDARARLDLDGRRHAVRAHRGSRDGLVRVLVAHDTLDRAARHEREARGRSADTEVDVPCLRRVLGMTRHDQDLARRDGELVPALAIAEPYRDGAAGLGIELQACRVDARACDHAAGHIRHVPVSTCPPAASTRWTWPSRPATTARLVAAGSCPCADAAIDHGPGARSSDALPSRSVLTMTTSPSGGAQRTQASATGRRCR